MPNPTGSHDSTARRNRARLPPPCPFGHEGELVNHWDAWAFVLWWRDAPKPKPYVVTCLALLSRVYVANEDGHPTLEAHTAEGIQRLHRDAASLWPRFVEELERRRERA
ncbi:MAG: hypothetical protein ACYTHK_19605 [Planctomycetota bacterium]